jgi:hypothetical protein
MTVMVGLAGAFEFARSRVLAQRGEGPTDVLHWMSGPVEVVSADSVTVERHHRLRGRVYGTAETWAVAERLVQTCRERDVVLCRGESVAAAFVSLGGRRRCGALVVMVDGADTRPNNVVVRLMKQHVDLYLVPTRQRLASLRRQLPDGTLVQPLIAVDTHFFSPGENDQSRPGQPLIASGRPGNCDYALLTDAIAGVRATVEIGTLAAPAAYDVENSRMPRVIPGDMHVREMSIVQRRDLFRRCSLVVAPLMPGGGSLALTMISEAMAIGKPVVATVASPDIAELVDAGALVGVRPGDSGQLRRAISLVLEDRDHAAELGQAARAYAVQHWEVTRTAASLDRSIGLVAPRSALALVKRAAA